MYVCMDVWMYGCMDVWMDGWMGLVGLVGLIGFLPVSGAVRPYPPEFYGRVNVFYPCQNSTGFSINEGLPCFRDAPTPWNGCLPHPLPQAGCGTFLLVML